MREVRERQYIFIRKKLCFFVHSLVSYLVLFEDCRRFSLCQLSRNHDERNQTNAGEGREERPSFFLHRQ